MYCEIIYHSKNKYQMKFSSIGLGVPQMLSEQRVNNVITSLNN